MDSMMTRRGFLAAGASCAALAAIGTSTGCSSSQTEPLSSDASVTYTKATLCAGCANKCGIEAWVRGGKLWRFMGAEGHPHSGGYMCGRGQGLPSLTTSEDRVTEPMKADGKGGFVKVSWDDALSDIASHITGAGSKVALFQDGRATDAWYAKRFMASVGSPNYYDDSALTNANIDAAYKTLLGTTPVFDTANAEYIVLLDASGDETVRPVEVKEFQKVRENGGYVMAVDPRNAGADMLADEWVAVRPGYELAFLLGIMGDIAKKLDFDASFVEQYGEGFEEFRTAMLQYTPEWASEKCGVSIDAIYSAARGLVKAAPHCHVDVRPGALLGCGYATSLETVRCAVLLNAMLGAVNQTGGMFLAKVPAVDESVFESAPFTKVSASGDGIAQAGELGVASCQEALGAAAKGGADVALFVECDPAADWADSAKVEENLSGIGFKVVIDSVLTETAQKADYVLPAATYLEVESVVAPVAAEWSVAEKRNQAVAPAGEARAVYQIFTDLAKACGKGDDFAFELDDVNNAFCRVYGITLDGLNDTACCAIPGASVLAGDAPAIGTDSGKIPFASDVFEKAGLARVPQYADPTVAPNDHMPRLITGAQSMQTRTYTADADKIVALAKDSGAERAWLNPQTATNFGIADGDEAELSTSTGKIRVKVRVTSLINPEAVYVPPHYGIESKEMAQAAGYGASVWDIVPRASDAVTGAGMVCEVPVEIRKVGA